MEDLRRISCETRSHYKKSYPIVMDNIKENRNSIKRHSKANRKPKNFLKLQSQTSCVLQTPVVASKASELNCRCDGYMDSSNTTNGNICQARHGKHLLNVETTRSTHTVGRGSVNKRNTNNLPAWLCTSKAARKVPCSKERTTFAPPPLLTDTSHCFRCLVTPSVPELLNASCTTPTIPTTPSMTTASANNWWHQVLASLLWHISASTAISLLVTFCWIIAHTHGAVTANGPGDSSPGEPFHYASSSTAAATMPTTTPTPATTISPSAILDISMPMGSSKDSASRPLKVTSIFNSQRYNRIKNIRNRGHHSVPGSNKNSNNNNAMSSASNGNYHINSTTEITLLHDMAVMPSPAHPTMALASAESAEVERAIATNHMDDTLLLLPATVNIANVSSLDRNLSQISGTAVDGAATVTAISFDDISAEDTSEYIFDRTDVRIIFITLYTMVFCCCFFGNLLVILVVTLSRRLRSITNFFLANLALADFCVGLFCVMQNLSIYLIDSWVFGEFLCRMYQFVHSLSYTASIFILVVICMERYFAIVHPITCKQILTAARLRMVILTVWITSAVYSTPKFVFSKTIKNVHTESGQEEEICVLDRKMYNSKLLDMINFVLLYVIPLLVMTVLYSKIAIALWRSSRGLSHHLAQQQENSMGLHNSMYHHNHQQHHNHHHHPHHAHHLAHNSHHHHPHPHPHPHHQLQQPEQQPSTPLAVNSASGASSGHIVATSLSRKHSSKYEKRGVSITESQHDVLQQVSLDADRPVVSTCRKTSFYQHNHLAHHHGQPAGSAPAANHHHLRSQHAHHNHGAGAGVGSGGLHGSQRVSHFSNSSNNVLRARRGVVRMLIIFVLTFALCNLPYHARKMWQYWSRSYRGDSNFNALFTPLTFLVTYFNSGINPLLYAFLSRNFRKGMKELLMCSWRKSKTKSSTNSSMHHKRMTLQTHSLPTDTTHIGNEQL